MNTEMEKSLRLRLYDSMERLLLRRREIAPLLGDACDPGLAGKLDREPEQGVLNFEWGKQCEAENAAVDTVLRGLVALRAKPSHDEFAPLTPDKVWMWGGPTPLWGGSMADDCLVRETGKFGIENAVYVYGPTTEKMLGLHSGYKKLLCQVNSNCRTKGMLAGSEEENAELLSKLSLSHPNIAGAMCDDFFTGFQYALLPERFEKIYRGVKKYNDKLKVYGVIYAHEFGVHHFDLIQPYIDVVNLWLWNKEELLDVDSHVERCRKEFPGKPILMGIFIHDYGRSDLGTPEELLIYQLERAGVFLKKGWLEGVVILGDREVRKWPKQAEAIRKFLKEDQYKL